MTKHTHTFAGDNSINNNRCTYLYYLLFRFRLCTCPVGSKPIGLLAVGHRASHVELWRKRASTSGGHREKNATCMQHCIQVNATCTEVTSGTNLHARFRMYWIQQPDGTAFFTVPIAEQGQAFGDCGLIVGVLPCDGAVNYPCLSVSDSIGDGEGVERVLAM